MSDESKRHQLKWAAATFAARVVVLLVLGAVVYLWRPLFHGLIYRMVYSVGGLLSIGLPLTVAVLLFLFPTLTVKAVLFLIPQVDGGPRPPSPGPMPTVSRSDADPSDSTMLKATILGLALALGIVLALLVGIPSGMVEERTIAQQTMEGADEVEDFPAINEENARVVPRQVSDIQTRGSVSYRKYELGTSDIARMEDGRLAWSYAIIPDGLRNAIYEHQAGVVMTDMTSIDDRQIQATDNQSFEIGEGMILQRGSEWNLEKTDYWAQYRDDAVEFVHDGDPYMYYAKTGHEWHLSPIPHTTPTWEGGALIHPDGTIEHLSPEEAQNSEILDGQRLYPLYNTNREMESLGYRNGIVNQMGVVGTHEGQVEVAGMPSGAGNSQPFVIDLEGEQMSYTTAMEPHGEDTRGLDEVWFADARNGTYRYYATGSETLTGPERAMGIVRSADTQTGWGDDFEVIEPVPVTVDDELWWHAKVVPTDFTDISRNVFVNSHTGEALEIHDDEAIREFLAGETVDDEAVEEVTTDEEAAEGDPDVAYYVVILGADGEEIDRIPVEPGQDVNIVQDGPNSTASGSNETTSDG